MGHLVYGCRNLFGFGLLLFEGLLSFEADFASAPVTMKTSAKKMVGGWTRRQKGVPVLPALRAAYSFSARSTSFLSGQDLTDS